MFILWNKMKIFAAFTFWTFVRFLHKFSSKRLCNVLEGIFVSILSPFFLITVSIVRVSLCKSYCADVNVFIKADVFSQPHVINPCKNKASAVSHRSVTKSRTDVHLHLRTKEHLHTTTCPVLTGSDTAAVCTHLTGRLMYCTCMEYRRKETKRVIKM